MQLVSGFRQGIEDLFNVLDAGRNVNAEGGSQGLVVVLVV